MWNIVKWLFLFMGFTLIGAMLDQAINQDVNTEISNYLNPPPPSPSWTAADVSSAYACGSLRALRDALGAGPTDQATEDLCSKLQRAGFDEAQTRMYDCLERTGWGVYMDKDRKQIDWETYVQPYLNGMKKK